MFEVREWVVRTTDDAEGVVTANISGGAQVWFPRDHCHQWVSNDLLRRRWTIHAHVVTHSSDCDGSHERRYLDVMSLEERCDQFGDIAFRERVLGDVVSLHSTGTLAVTPDKIDWDEQTEEGYRHVTVKWCDEDKCYHRLPPQRDFRAELTGHWY